VTGNSGAGILLFWRYYVITAKHKITLAGLRPWY
jgi:hypothetical protein